MTDKRSDNGAAGELQKSGATRASQKSGATRASHPTGQFLPELLAPCGSPEAVRAAVNAGADAVYLGGKRFNARANAKNFDDVELERTIAFCHDAGVRVYVTLNTMLYDRELPDSLEYAGFLYNSGVDSVIAADLGLIKLLCDRLPGLPVHVSTQAAVHNLSGIQKLAELGAVRAVVARELPKTELDALCKASPIELEMFVHGALCVSCSGQCLLSAVMGGRSGNRGECAQPCRLNYETLSADKRGNTRAETHPAHRQANRGSENKNTHPISLRDLCMAEHIPELIASGIASLKIEGRMKSPDYVAAVTRIYRTLLDERRAASYAEMETLRRIFSRGGFTDTYYTGAGGTLENMLGVRSEGDKSDTRSAGDSTSARNGASIYIKTPIAVSREKISVDASFKPPRSKNIVKPLNVGIFQAAEQIACRDFFDIILLPLDKFEQVAAKSGAAYGVVLPPVIFDGEREVIKRQLERVKSCGAEYLMIENPGQLGLAENFCATSGLRATGGLRATDGLRAIDELRATGGLYVIGGMRLNVANTAAAEFYSRNCEGLILSPELILPQIRDINYGAKGAIVYGRLPLMTFARRLGGNAAALRDRAGAVFPVLATGTRDILYNSVPIYMADKLPALDAAGIKLRVFIFTTETQREVETIAAAYKKGLPPTDKNIRRIK